MSFLMQELRNNLNLKKLLNEFSGWGVNRGNSTALKEKDLLNNSQFCLTAISNQKPSFAKKYWKVRLQGVVAKRKLVGRDTDGGYPTGSSWKKSLKVGKSQD